MVTNIAVEEHTNPPDLYRTPIYFQFMFTMISYFHRYRLEFERQDGDCCDERLTMVSWYLA